MKKKYQEEKVQCPFCNKVYSRKDNLKVHIEKYCKITILLKMKKQGYHNKFDNYKFKKSIRLRKNCVKRIENIFLNLKTGRDAP